MMTVTLRGHTEKVETVKLSPNGQLFVTTSQDNTTRVWEAANGQLLATFETPNVWGAEFSSDSNQIITATGYGISQVFRLVTLSDVERMLTN